MYSEKYYKHVLATRTDASGLKTLFNNCGWFETRVANFFFFFFWGGGFLGGGGGGGGGGVEKKGQEKKSGHMDS